MRFHAERPDLWWVDCATGIHGNQVCQVRHTLKTLDAFQFDIVTFVRLICRHSAATAPSDWAVIVVFSGQLQAFTRDVVLVSDCGRNVNASIAPTEERLGLIV